MLKNCTSLYFRFLLPASKATSIDAVLAPKMAPVHVEVPPHEYWPNWQKLVLRAQATAEPDSTWNRRSIEQNLLRSWQPRLPGMPIHGRRCNGNDVADLVDRCRIRSRLHHRPRLPPAFLQRVGYLSCYETILSGRVMYNKMPLKCGRALFTSFTFCNITGSCSLRLIKRIYML